MIANLLCVGVLSITQDQILFDEILGVKQGKFQKPGLLGLKTRLVNGQVLVNDLDGGLLQGC